MSTEERIKFLKTVLIIVTVEVFAKLYRERSEKEKELSPTEFIEKVVNDIEEYVKDN